MDITSLLEALAALAVIVWISARQLRWAPVVPGNAWRMPVILAIIGVVTVAQSHVTTVTRMDVVILLASAVAAIATGALMGAIARFRPIGDAALARVMASRRAPDVLPTVESRTGWLGIALWIVLIAVRVGLDVYAHVAGAALAASTGVILLAIAVNRGSRLAVMLLRLERHSALVA
ncbi:hypothetical protein QT381_13780 [Galbitalea sp. SE-J8]|uniref:hypothetical protein n=1 Tax=Galbitalea sp. SE-J8 TaxID=3054952 RepID=UPI00259C7C92|nr:hypothetical protein [Galbitalea sp. SE-J8]MDM4764080.1 hypothetical protein [Galbitalea sp. SE-J8]